jgi:type IV pilus assembly protein PilA
MSGESTRSRVTDIGFTLIELLVVVSIIAILAAISIPSYLRHREKAMRANATSDMKNAATAVESVGTENDGSFLPADGATQDSAILQDEGFNPSNWVELTVVATVSDYCIRGLYTAIPDKEFVYRSTTGVVVVGDLGVTPCV